MKKVGLVLMLSLLMAACSTKYTSNGEQQYLKSRNGVNVVVPPPLTAANISHFYDLPSQDQGAQVSIEPPTVKGAGV